MEKLLLNNESYSYYQYEKEAEFESLIVENSKVIFGESSIYIDIKKRIGDEILSIPDGYLIDFTIPGQPRLYIIENEIVKHDPYKHIGQQILKFAISYKASGRKIKQFILEHIQENKEYVQLINSAIERDEYRNIDALLEDIIFDQEVGCIVVIDEATNELENVLSQLTIKTDIIQFQTFKNENNISIHKFEEFQSDVRPNFSANKSLGPEQFDTIVVPAQEDGFNDVFIGENCWYSIRISGAMVDRIKYVAAYQVAPISAITYVAEVSYIEKYKNTNKYIIYFKSEPSKIGPVKLEKNRAGLAPQSPRYTSYNKLKLAKTLSDVF